MHWLAREVEQTSVLGVCLYPRPTGSNWLLRQSSITHAEAKVQEKDNERKKIDKERRGHKAEIINETW